ncbi:hypothetical protein C5167_028587 [Papaver somniferum]|uniref:uncharacterized protein LOC113338498 n=1 Tax=Papaver somniferum TaxID=3469 RepID=UPI000E6FFA31|nr:uncharacterized protein LOC113338498 [Papaver somniferum]RZC90756.1 hypothetical protein C5167_028587 [Papaver somniferum]
MAMRVILTKISPFASLEASSLGFIEGAQRVRRYIFDPEAYRREKLDKGVDLKEDMTIAELDELFRSSSLEDLCKVNWNKYSKNKLSFAETRTESTKEMERLVRKMMLDEMDKKKKKFVDREEKRIDDDMRKGN